MSGPERAAIIEQGLRSQFWLEYLLPMLQEYGKNAMESLLAKRADNDDIIRGQAQAYRQIIQRPAADAAMLRAEDARAAEDHAAAEREQFHAINGFRSPYREAPQPGNLRADENTPDSAI